MRLGGGVFEILPAGESLPGAQRAEAFLAGAGLLGDGVIVVVIVTSFVVVVVVVVMEDVAGRWLLW